MDVFAQLRAMQQRLEVLERQQRDQQHQSSRATSPSFFAPPPLLAGGERAKFPPVTGLTVLTQQNQQRLHRGGSGSNGSLSRPGSGRARQQGHHLPQRSPASSSSSPHHAFVDESAARAALDRISPALPEDPAPGGAGSSADPSPSGSGGSGRAFSSLPSSSAMAAPGSGMEPPSFGNASLLGTLQMRDPHVASSALSAHSNDTSPAGSDTSR